MNILSKGCKVLFSANVDSQIKLVELAVQQGAYLQGADLQGADLQGAYLQGADLQGADLQDGLLIRGQPLYIGPLGSRQAYTAFWLTDQGIYVKCGCFFGDLESFKERVQSVHKDNTYAQQYFAAMTFAQSIFKE